MRRKDLELGEGVELVKEKELEGDLKKEVEDGKLSEVIKQGDLLAPIPVGFSVSRTEGENTISGGLVIYDGESNENRNNEFVWIPYTDSKEYVEEYVGPITEREHYHSYSFPTDSQKNLDYWYGENFYNYSQDFNYEEDKENIENSINKYKGFYIGRYETKIDDGKICVKKNAEILTSQHILKEGINSNCNEPYYYRWWGLYKTEKDMYNNEAVFSSMITSGNRQVIMIFTDNCNSIDNDINKNINDLIEGVWEISLSIYNRDYRNGFGRT